MFGLIFFPDRARGLAELHRVLERGGRVAISSWPPSDRVPMMQALFAAMREKGLSLPQGAPSLGDPADCERELGAAGFHDIRVELLTELQQAPTLDALWDSLARSMAPPVFMRKQLGEECWDKLAAAIRARLSQQFGEGAQRVELHAWIGTATA